jgi:hypothetical protein
MRDLPCTIVLIASFHALLGLSRISWISWTVSVRFHCIKLLIGISIILRIRSYIIIVPRYCDFRVFRNWIRILSNHTILGFNNL